MLRTLTTRWRCCRGEVSRFSRLVGCCVNNSFLSNPNTAPHRAAGDIAAHAAGSSVLGSQENLSRWKSPRRRHMDQRLCHTHRFKPLSGSLDHCNAAADLLRSAGCYFTSCSVPKEGWREDEDEGYVRNSQCHSILHFSLNHRQPLCFLSMPSTSEWWGV